LKKILFILYRINIQRIRNFIINRIGKMEGGEPHSKTLREIFKVYHNVIIGEYTMGGCFNPNLVGPYTTIGRYCSLARTAFIRNRNHPINFKSTHPFFFNPGLGYCKTDNVGYKPLVIENDVWIGHNAIIMPHVASIGNGAIIGAGAVVNKDIPPYAIVVGNPARIARYRFSPEAIEKLLNEKWWEKDMDEISKDIDAYCIPYEKKDEQDNQDNF